MSRIRYCEACRMYSSGAKTRIAIEHTCEDGGRRLTNLLKVRELNKSGFAGVGKNGQIVDRRENPEAVPIPKNAMFNAESPRCINCERATTKLLNSLCDICRKEIENILQTNG